jgi:hypothetical protein
VRPTLLVFVSSTADFLALAESALLSYWNFVRFPRLFFLSTCTELNGFLS